MSTRRKRERLPSLSLESVLNSTSDDSTVNLSALLKLQTALASTDLNDLVKSGGIPEDLILLWIVSRIGFLNTTLLLKCITEVPKAMLTHRREYILEEVNKLTNNSVDGAGSYIDLMLLYCPNSCQSKYLNPKKQRYT